MRSIGAIGLLLVLSALACRATDMKLGVSFEAANGVQREDRVLFENNPAGKVSHVEYCSDGTYLVHLLVDKGFSNALTEQSQFRIINDPVKSGHKAVEIRLTRPGGRRLPEGASVKGESEPSSNAFLEKNLETGLSFLRERLNQLARDVRQIPESGAYRQLEKSLSELADEIARSEEQARRKLKQEWLPLIEKELDEFKKRLRQFGHEGDARPLENEPDRIRRI